MGNLSATVPASSVAGDSYTLNVAIDKFDGDQVAAANFPDVFVDQKAWPWVNARRIFAGDTPPASNASQGVNGWIDVDMKSKRRCRGFREELHLVGHHDNGLGANPTLFWNLSMLWVLH